MPTDEEVKGAYRLVRRGVVESLEAGGFDAEWIDEKDAIYATMDTNVGRIVVYFSTIVFGGLMSDGQLADARAHAEVLAERIRERELPRPLYQGGETDEPGN
jgi:hypothetical protein